jgi:hypothetical protein
MQALAGERMPFRWFIASILNATVIAVAMAV